MLRIQFFFAVLLANYIYLYPDNALADSCSNFSRASELASKYRGLPYLHQVKCTPLNKSAFKELFEERIKKQIQHMKLSNEGLVYKLLGFIPIDYDYSTCILESYFNDTAAFFRAEKNDFIVLDGLASDIFSTVHELTHALQNQHFNINNLTDIKSESTDALMAKFVLIEGDAVVVEHSLPKSTFDLASSTPQSNSSIANQTSKNNCKLLLQLEEMMSFPYDKGGSFVSYLKKTGGYNAVNKAFEIPPDSTSEILHPEKYLARIGQPKNASILPDIKESQIKGDKVFSDRMGEFFINRLLAQYPSNENKSFSYSNWQDDWLVLYNLPNNTFQLQWDIIWHTPEVSAKFAELLSNLFSIRLVNVRVRKEGNVYRISDTVFGEVSIKVNENQISLMIISKKDIL